MNATAPAQPALFPGHGPFAALPSMHYGLIMADPPWRFALWSERGEEKSPQAHYRTMATDEIAALPVGSLAAADCVLFLWATWPMLDAGRRVLDAWGFRYASGGAWLKTTARGKVAFGTGYRLRSACEPWLIGIAGNPTTARDHRNLIEGEARGHSVKPEAAYRWCESYCFGPRLELFSRRSRQGWDAWGDEAGKLDGKNGGKQGGEAA